MAGRSAKRRVRQEIPEATLWSSQEPTASAALRFSLAFLGCRMGPNKDLVIDANARNRLLALVRAVSIVESRHGTTGASQPARDPFQCGNPNDAWWTEFTGPAGRGSRFIRGPGLTNAYAGDLGDLAEAAAGFPSAAKRSLLTDVSRGHRDSHFAPAHSYVWGILYLIHRVNSEAGDPTYACGDLSRSRLLDGAVTYNGGGVPDYRDRLESALDEFGDPLSIPFMLQSRESTDDATHWIAAARATGQVIKRIDVRFDTISARPALVTIEFYNSTESG